MSRKLLPIGPISGIVPCVSETEARPRGRPRQFDEEAALRRLTALFWRNGYTRTSITDLVEASGVHRPSLYRTFGTKEELFATILRRFFDARVESLRALLDRVTPDVDGIHTFVATLRDDILSDPERRGCLVAASTAELGGTAPGFEGFGTAYRDALRGVYRDLVAHAGGDDAAIDARAELMVTWSLGLDVSVRAGADDDELDRIFDAMHATVDDWSGGRR